MKTVNNKYAQLILVCVNERADKPCCKARGGEDLYFAIKTKAAEISPQIRVSKSSCLGSCKSGSIIVLQPQNIWFEQVKLSDIAEIFSHIPNTVTSFDVDELLDPSY